LRILVTGIAGFIGSHLSERLLADGHEVVGIDDCSTGRYQNVPEGAKFILGDVRDADTVNLAGDVDVIYHCAASYRDHNDWERDASTNVLGTINVLRLAKASLAKVIYTQTSLCYGLYPKSPITIDAQLDPHGSYAVSKTSAEAYIRDSGVKFVSLRLANVFGPRNLSGPVPAFFRRLSNKEPCVVVDTRRDFIFISDLVDLAVQMADEGSGFVHVSTGQDVQIIDIYRAVVKAMGLSIPEPEIRERGADDAPTLLLDPSETRSKFGWRANVSIEDGVAKAVEWYAKNGVPDLFTHLELKG
jgi:UDP-glucose 4-epimerase